MVCGRQPAKEKPEKDAQGALRYIYPKARQSLLQHGQLLSRQRRTRASHRGLFSYLSAGVRALLFWSSVGLAVPQKPRMYLDDASIKQSIFSCHATHAFGRSSGENDCRVSFGDFKLTQMLKVLRADLYRGVLEHIHAHRFPLWK